MAEPSTTPVPLKPNEDRTACARLRNRGLRVRAIAKKLGMPERRVEYHLMMARRCGMLVSPSEYVDAFLVPRAIDRVAQTIRRSKDERLATSTALKALEGGHVLHRPDSDAGTGAAPVVSLTVRIEQPPGVAIRTPETLIGQVVGIPRGLDPPPPVEEIIVHGQEITPAAESPTDAPRQLRAGAPADPEATRVLWLDRERRRADAEREFRAARPEG
jgi:hypothetical protein